MNLMPSGERTSAVSLRHVGGVRILQLQSDDGTNRLRRSTVESLIKAIDEMLVDPRPLIFAGNEQFFSAGADLREIASLTGPAAYEFAHLGQRLMNSIVSFPAPVSAAISGYCMGGGLDLALACHSRFASPNAVFGHRGASLGLITGWGGTQRLSRLVGKARASQMFVAAEKIEARSALQYGLVHQVVEDPLRAALTFAQSRAGTTD